MSSAAIQHIFTTPFRVHCRTLPSDGGRRMFAVKELAWCAPKGSPNSMNQVVDDQTETQRLERRGVVPVKQFGVVAAMSKNRVLGVDGKLPWNVPDDRKIFTELTREKVLIIGRKTLEEQPNHSHVRHTRHCIVVSSTLDQEKIRSYANISIARSFPEALGMARIFGEELNEGGGDCSINKDEIDCWIGGGQAIFEQALRHESASELRLSMIDTEVEISSRIISMFPPKHRWDNKFDEVARTDMPQFTHVVYRRKKR